MYLQRLICTPRGIVSVYALFERCFIRGTVYVLYERVCVRTKGYCVRNVSEVLCRYCARGSVYILRGTVYVMYQRYCV